MAVTTIPSNLFIRRKPTGGGDSGGGDTIEVPEYFVIETIQNELFYYGYDFGYVSGIEFLASDETTVLATSLVQDGDDSSTDSLVYDSNGDYKPGLSAGVPLGATEPVYYVGQNGGEYRWIHEYYGRNATLPFRVPTGLDLSQVAFIKILSGQGLPVDTLNAYAVYSDDRVQLIGTEDYTSEPVGLDTQPNIPISFDQSGSGTTFYPYNILALQYINNISISGDVSFSESSKAKPDGTKIYVYGTGDGTIKQYSLSEPWDLDTATLETQSPSLDAQNSFVTSIFFKPDGTKVYAATQNKTVYQYTLTTPWDVSTLVYDNVVLDYTQSALDSYTTWIFIDSTGTNMYGSNGNTIVRFPITTAWDISTASWEELFTTTARSGAQIKGMFMDPTSTKMFVLELLFEWDTFIDQYDLTQANTLSSATYTATYTVDTSVTQGSDDIYIDTDNGHEMIILGAGRVHRFQFSSDPNAGSGDGDTGGFVCCPEWDELGTEQYTTGQYGEYDITINESVVGTRRYYDLYQADPSWAFTTTDVRGVGNLYVYDGSAYPSGATLTRRDVTVDGTIYNPAGELFIDELCVYVEFVSNNEVATDSDIDFVVNAYNTQGTVIGTTDASITQTEYQSNTSKVYKISVPIDPVSNLNQIEFVSQTYPTAIIRDIRVCRDGNLVAYPFLPPS